VEFIAANAKQATEAGDKAALVAEEVEEGRNPGTINGVTRTEASRENGKPLVPTIELRSYHCKALKAEVAAVDMAGIEDVPGRPIAMSGPAVLRSSNMILLKAITLLTLAMH
jgi:hypothetical protein